MAGIWHVPFNGRGMSRRFNIATLKALAQAPADNAASWLVGAEESVEFLKENALDIVIRSGLGIEIGCDEKVIRCLAIQSK